MCVKLLNVVVVVADWIWWNIGGCFSGLAGSRAKPDVEAGLTSFVDCFNDGLRTSSNHGSRSAGLLAQIRLPVALHGCITCPRPNKVVNSLANQKGSRRLPRPLFVESRATQRSHEAMLCDSRGYGVV